MRPTSTALWRRRITKRRRRITPTSRLFQYRPVSTRLINGERQQSDFSRSLDRACDYSLVRSTTAGSSSRENLPPVGDVLAQLCYVLVIDAVDLVHAEGAYSTSWSAELTTTTTTTRPAWSTLLHFIRNLHKGFKSSLDGLCRILIDH